RPRRTAAGRPAGTGCPRTAARAAAPRSLVLVDRTGRSRPDQEEAASGSRPAAGPGRHRAAAGPRRRAVGSARAAAVAGVAVPDRAPDQVAAGVAVPLGPVAAGR